MVSLNMRVNRQREGDRPEGWSADEGEGVQAMSNLFKVVEKKTGREAVLDRYYGEDWLPGHAEDNYCDWIFTSWGEPLVYDETDSCVYTPPRGRFEIRRGIGLEGGWDRPVFEGDYIILTEARGRQFRGKIRFGKYFTTERKCVRLHVGFYAEWQEEYGFDLTRPQELGEWLMDDSLSVSILSPGEFQDYYELENPSEKAHQSSEADGPKPENPFTAVRGSKEGFMSVPSEEEMELAFLQMDADTDPDIRQLLAIRDGYRPGDLEKRQALFALLDKKLLCADADAAEHFIAAMDLCFPDAREIREAWNHVRRAVLSLFGVLPS